MLRPGIEPVISFTGVRDYARSAVASWTSATDDASSMARETSYPSLCVRSWPSPTLAGINRIDAGSLQERLSEELESNAAKSRSSQESPTSTVVWARPCRAVLRGTHLTRILPRLQRMMCGKTCRLLFNESKIVVVHFTCRKNPFI